MDGIILLVLFCLVITLFVSYTNTVNNDTV